MSQHPEACENESKRRLEKEIEAMIYMWSCLHTGNNISPGKLKSPNKKMPLSSIILTNVQEYIPRYEHAKREANCKQYNYTAVITRI
jgi:hypothetical protein